MQRVPETEAQRTSEGEYNTMNTTNLIRRAESWRKNNPKAWNHIVSRALKETMAKRKFGVQALIESARRKDFATNDGSRFTINNSFQPVFARMLIKEYPEMEPYIELRKSELDEEM